MITKIKVDTELKNIITGETIPCVGLTVEGIIPVLEKAMEAETLKESGAILLSIAEFYRKGKKPLTLKIALSAVLLSHTCAGDEKLRVFELAQEVAEAGPIVFVTADDIRLLSTAVKESDTYPVIVTGQILKIFKDADAADNENTENT